MNHLNNNLTCTTTCRRSRSTCNRRLKIPVLLFLLLCAVLCSTLSTTATSATKSIMSISILATKITTASRSHRRVLQGPPSHVGSGGPGSVQVEEAEEMTEVAVAAAAAAAAEEEMTAEENHLGTGAGGGGQHVEAPGILGPGAGVGGQFHGRHDYNNSRDDYSTTSSVAAASSTSTYSTATSTDIDDEDNSRSSNWKIIVGIVGCMVASLIVISMLVSKHKHNAHARRFAQLNLPELNLTMTAHVKYNDSARGGSLSSEGSDGFYDEDTNIYNSIENTGRVGRRDSNSSNSSSGSAGAIFSQVLSKIASSTTSLDTTGHSLKVRSPKITAISRRRQQQQVAFATGDYKGDADASTDLSDLL